MRDIRFFTPWRVVRRALFPIRGVPALALMDYALRSAGVYEESANMVVNGARTLGNAPLDDKGTQPIKAV